MIEVTVNVRLSYRGRVMLRIANALLRLAGWFTRSAVRTAELDMELQRPRTQRPR